MCQSDWGEYNNPRKQNLNYTTRIYRSTRNSGIWRLLVRAKQDLRFQNPGTKKCSCLSRMGLKFTKIGGTSNGYEPMNLPNSSTVIEKILMNGE